ncbi:hypothetical protein M8C21_023782 [Ambrosia artemisiifolia]|uniref:Uncharacterized protein n=1 Tax=Ambrosia artemisiifolia TaxID=4212 RepID=A0AAD5BUE8_AMBAR|nr:hypothetical protein M8C21_023782 [Ambrosia artemisiifolia]
MKKMQYAMLDKDRDLSERPLISVWLNGFDMQPVE